MMWCVCVCVTRGVKERKEKEWKKEKGRRAENQSNRRTSDSGSVHFQSWHSQSSNLGTFPTSQAPVEMLTLSTAHDDYT